MLVKNLTDLDQLIPAFIDHAKSARKIMLIGEMGVGKTAFVQAFGKHIGVSEKIKSPTFALINEYTYSDASKTLSKVYHMDLYRLKSIEEALDIGIEDYLDNDAWCFIEWPELIADIWPPDVVQIKFDLLPNSNREILFL